jgi:alpha-beta hydrolase superfamily lysophospholipase
VVIIHGADSQKESHHDFARLLRDSGLAAVCFDLRGHGESPGPLDGRLLADVATIAALLPPGPVGLRGSSLGGYVASPRPRRPAPTRRRHLPAPGVGLTRGIRDGRFGFAADADAVEALISEHPLEDVVARSESRSCSARRGDERVPVQHSRELAARSAAEPTTLVVVPGGHHRSVQHDPELQAEAVRFLRRAFAAAGGGTA